ncbi:hypothetical protein GTY84_00515 [Streptomyces sp. SID8352]|nr:hypothetical protein [Streptomyces sp. SID8352]
MVASHSTAEYFTSPSTTLFYTKCVWARIALEPSDAAGPSGSLVPGGARARAAAPAEPGRPAHHDRVSP